MRATHTNSINAEIKFSEGKKKAFTSCVLVAGGAGFLGSHLCDHYLARGYRVICLDNLSTGRISNVEQLLGKPGFEFVEHDIIERFETASNVDLIFNMACPASPPKYQADPLRTFRTNIYGADNLLKLACEKKARILQASTSEVYGDPQVTPQREDYLGNVNTVGPRSCYDEGKRGAETLFYEYRQQYDLDVRIARIFNTYGPRMDPEDGRVVSNFVTQALRGDEITVYGNGAQTRSFCFVDDLVRGLTALMHLPTAPAHPVNLGNPEEFNMLELANVVLSHTASKSKIVFKDLPADDPQKRRPDISAATRLLDWKPTCRLQEGLQRTIPYFAAELSNAPIAAGVAAQ